MNLERFFSPVYASLKNNPEDWQRVDGYKIQHLPSGHKYWIGNGPLMFNGFGEWGTHVGFIEGFFCWPHVKRILSLATELAYRPDHNKDK